MVYSPWPIILLCLGYLLMCLVGPKIMAKRQPFELKPVLVVYNFMMVGLSFYITIEVMNREWKSCDSLAVVTS